MSIVGGIKQAYHLLGSAATSVSKWEDVELCPICKKQLIKGECREDHANKMTTFDGKVNNKR